jgi:hypothetical protein
MKIPNELEYFWKNSPLLPENFDWEAYVNNYEDIRKEGIDNEESASWHWINYGKTEGRTLFKLKDKKIIKVNNTKIKRIPSLFDNRYYCNKNGLKPLELKKAFKHYLSNKSGNKEINFIEEYINNEKEDTQYVANYIKILVNHIVKAKNVSILYNSDSRTLLAEKDNKLIDVSNKFLGHLLVWYYDRKKMRLQYTAIINTYYDLIKKEYYETIEEECFLGSDTITAFWGHMFEDVYNLLYTYINNGLKCKFVILDVKTNQLEFIKSFIPEERIFIMENDKKYLFNNIIFCQPYHGFYEEYNKKSIDFLNKIIYEKLPTLDVYYDKIFIVKTNKNSVYKQGVFDNVADLANILKEKGYLIVQPEEHDFIYIINLIKHCKLLVSQWGSSIYHNIYLNQGSTNICLCHRSYEEQYKMKGHLFYKLADHLNIDFLTLEDQADKININKVIEFIENIERKKLQNENNT